MATTDTPGYGHAKNDKLVPGVWGEHDDGSLILVIGVDENETIIFNIYDLTDDVHPVFYPVAMPKRDFEKKFSYNSADDKSEKWLWHDKTDFPWSVVMKHIDRPLPMPTTVDGQFSAAMRVAMSLDRHMGELVDKQHVRSAQGLEIRPSSPSSVTIRERLKRALSGLGL